MTLRIHALLHVDFEDLGYIAEWAQAEGHKVSYTRFYDGDTLPAQDSFDWLIIMGGPMSIHDEAVFDWLAAEKRFIQHSIDAGKNIIGFCLGSQLIAHVLGAAVAPSGVKEIGWLPIQLTAAGAAHPLLADLPKQAFTVFHWHGDGFACPEGAALTATSTDWAQQGFIYQTERHAALGTWVMGWQCHFEVTQASMAGMLTHGAAEITQEQARYPMSVQAADHIAALGNAHITDNNRWLAAMLARLVETRQQS